MLTDPTRAKLTRNSSHIVKTMGHLCGPKKFWTQKFFGPKFIWTQNLFGLKVFEPTIFLDLKFFLAQNFFGTQKLF